MLIELTIVADTQEELDVEYLKFDRMFKDQGLHQIKYNALKPRKVELTYVCAQRLKEHEERLTVSCRNSLGFTIDAPIINSILGMHGNSVNRKE